MLPPQMARPAGQVTGPDLPYQGGQTWLEAFMKRVLVPCNEWGGALDLLSNTSCLGWKLP